MDGDEIMETNIVKNIIMAVLFFVFLGMIELYVYNRKYK